MDYRRHQYRQLPLLAVVLCWLVSFASTAQAAIELSQPEQRINLFESAFAITDPNGQYGPEDMRRIATQTQINEQGRKRLPSNAMNYWFVLSLDNRSDTTDWVLRTDIMVPQRIDVYLPQASGGFQHVSATLSGDGATHRASFASGYHFPITLPKGEVTTLIVRIESGSFRNIPLDLQGAEAFHAQNASLEAVVLICLGIILALLLYNAFLSLGLRDITYGYYTLLAACNFVIQATHFGFFDVLLHLEDPNRARYIIFSYGFVIFAALFALRFLDLARLNRRLYQVYRGLIGFACAVLLVFPLTPDAMHPPLVRLLAIISSVLFLGTGLYAWLQGVKQARFYVLAWGALTLTLTIMIFGIVGLLPPLFASPLIFLIGTCAEMLLLSLALTDRVSQLQLEHHHFDQENQRKSRFLAAMSHEIRTPLNGVLGMAKALRSTPLNERQLQYVEAITTAGSHLNNLLSNVLDYARSQSEREFIRNSSFNPSGLLNEIATLISPQTEQKALALHVECSPGIPVMVQADVDRIRQALLNLTHNAIKFTDQGSITLRLDYIDVPASQLRFSVVDTGIGIKAGSQDKIFELFEQASDDIKHQFGGTGIGLALARHLIETLGGKIGVSPNIPQGSVFWFTVPVTVSAANAADIAGTHTAGHELRMLVVDDDPINRLVASSLLENLGVQVDTAGNSHEALAWVSQQQYQLILMDLHMPVVDGLETTRKIRALPAAEAANTPIIGLSAHVSGIEQQQCVQAGMNDVMLKPLKAEELVNYCLERQARTP